MILLLFALTLAQDDEQLRARQLFERLDSPRFKERNDAEAELAKLPVRLVPYVLELARSKGSVEVELRLAAAAVPPPWPTILEGTVSEARSTFEKLKGNENSERRRIAGTLLLQISMRPPAEAGSILLGLLKQNEAGIQDFALEGLCLYPPKDLSPVVKRLESPATARRAADLLIAAGDLPVVPKVVQIFRLGDVPACREAGRVLERLGAGDQVDAIVDLARSEERPDLQSIAIRILGRTGGPRAEDALIGVLRSSPVLPRQMEAARALEWLGGEGAIRALREYFERTPDPPERERSLFVVRDPTWASERLVEARKDPSRFFPLTVLHVAAAGGPGVRDEALARLKDPRVAVSEQQLFLPLLGATGKREDGPLIAERLSDNRLMEAAADGLDMIGDPAHARALMRAYKTSPAGINVGRTLIALASEEFEDDTLEILSDPQGYVQQSRVALALAGRRLTPRGRELLFKGLLQGGIAWSGLRAEAARILAEKIQPGDRPQIEMLRAVKDPNVRVFGHLLAVRSGDAGAAADLAHIVAGGERFLFSHLAAHRSSPSALLLEWAAPAGEAWTHAVLEEWRRRPEWMEGAVWLARRGVGEPRDGLRVRLDKLDAAWRPRAEAALAATGDAETIKAILNRAWVRGALTGDEQQALAAGAGPEARARVLAIARSRLRFGDDSFVRLAAVLSLPEGVPIYREIVARPQGEWAGSAGGEPVAVPCAIALGRLKVAAAAEDLRRMLRSQHPASRAAAATALAEMDDRSALHQVIRLVADPFEVVAAGDDEALGRHFRPRRRVWHGAMEALEKLTGARTEGATIADRRDFWRAWYAEHRADWK